VPPKRTNRHRRLEVDHASLMGLRLLMTNSRPHSCSERSRNEHKCGVLETTYSAGLECQCRQESGYPFVLGAVRREIAGGVSAQLATVASSVTGVSVHSLRSMHLEKHLWQGT